MIAQHNYWTMYHTEQLQYSASGSDINVNDQAAPGYSNDVPYTEVPYTEVLAVFTGEIICPIIA